jgi:hypothetical protein
VRAVKPLRRGIVPCLLSTLRARESQAIVSLPAPSPAVPCSLRDDSPARGYLRLDGRTGSPHGPTSGPLEPVETVAAALGCGAVETGRGPGGGREPSPPAVPGKATSYTGFRGKTGSFRITETPPDPGPLPAPHSYGPGPFCAE